MTPVTIEGSAKCGLQFGLNLTALETWDLAGIDIKVGPAAKASVSYTVRDAGNVLCSDVRTYIYAAGELNPDTVVGKFLKTVWHYTLSKDFLSDDDDNPLKLKVHFENGTLVDKCTVGAGSIEGSVLDSNSKAPVKMPAWKHIPEQSRLKKLSRKKMELIHLMILMKEPTKLLSQQPVTRNMRAVPWKYQRTRSHTQNLS